jgi:hypothetical protein
MHLGRLAVFFGILAVIGFIAAWQERKRRHRD